MALDTRIPTNSDYTPVIPFSAAASEVAYAANPEIVLDAVLENNYKFAQLTGAMTVDVDTTKGKDFDKVIMSFAADGTQRVVTFGTGFISSGTLTIPASKKAIVTGVVIDGEVRIASREIQA